MAHGLGLKVVAEGVETEEQLVLLALHGCDFAQGFLLSKPVSDEIIMQLLELETCAWLSGYQKRYNKTFVLFCVCMAMKYHFYMQYYSEQEYNSNDKRQEVQLQGC